MIRTLRALMAAAAAVAALSALARAGAEAAWSELPAHLRGDSLVRALDRMESRPSGRVAAGDAAMALGQFHYARAEYAGAAEDFTRAASRLAGQDRAAAQYWRGLSLIGLGRLDAARSALREALDQPGETRSLALLGIAQSYELEHATTRALEAYTNVLAGDPGEAGPAALERYAVLAEQLHRPEDAANARERLVHFYPLSLEAARWLGSRRPEEAR